jgi:hypothetical protein
MEKRNNQDKLLLVIALKVRKLLLKFLKNSRCRIGPFAVQVFLHLWSKTAQWNFFALKWTYCNSKLIINDSYYCNGIWINFYVLPTEAYESRPSRFFYFRSHSTSHISKCTRKVVCQPYFLCSKWIVISNELNLGPITFQTFTELNILIIKKVWLAKTSMFGPIYQWQNHLLQ